MIRPANLTMCGHNKVTGTIDNVVSGVLYDFMGWLTTTNDAAPAADAVKEFCELRGVEDCEPFMQWDGMLANEVTGRVEMEEFKVRLVEEHFSLKAKLDKLNEFIDLSPTYNSLSYDDQDILVRQAEAMQMYANILYKRIKAG